MTPLSDIDLVVVFKDQLTDLDRQHFTAAATTAKGRSPRSLDIICLDEVTLLHADQIRLAADWRPVRGTVTIKCASALATRTDIRDATPSVRPDVYRRILTHFPYHMLQGQPGHPPRLHVPLPFPDPDDEFFGYPTRPLRAADGTQTPSTKRLAHASGFIATALVALHTTRYIADQRTAVMAYQADIDDAWTEHLTAIQHYCGVRWA